MSTNVREKNKKYGVTISKICEYDILKTKNRYLSLFFVEAACAFNKTSSVTKINNLDLEEVV